MRLSNNTKLYVGIVIALIIGVAVGYFARARMTKRVDVAIYEVILAALLGTFEGGIQAGGLAKHWTGHAGCPRKKSSGRQSSQNCLGFLPYGPIATS